MKRHLIAAGCVLCALLPAHARATMRFVEHFQTGFAIPVTPLDPYQEGDFILATTTDQAGIFRTDSFITMSGWSSTWFGFADGTRSAVTVVPGGTTFRLDSLVVGPISIGTGAPVNFTVLGTRQSGGALTQTFSGLTTATPVSLGWTGLTRVEFSADDDVGLDDLELIADPPVASPPGTVLRFENFAQSSTGDRIVVNINPGQPYQENGYVMEVLNDQAAVFDGTSLGNMPGVPSDWFGFGPGNVVTLRPQGGQSTFSLESLVVGPVTLDSLRSPTAVTDITITGTLEDGSTVSETFSGLAVGTTATLGWTGLTKVQFQGTGDSGLDDIHVSAVPEPAASWTLAGGLALIGAWTRRRRRGGPNRC